MSESHSQKIDKFLKNRPSEEDELVRKFTSQSKTQLNAEREPSPSELIELERLREQQPLRPRFYKDPKKTPIFRSYLQWQHELTLNSIARNTHSCELWKGNLILVGGHDNQNFVKNFFQVYEPSQHKWQQWTLVPLSQGDSERVEICRYGHVSWIYGSNLYIFAGYRDGWLNDLWFVDLKGLQKKSAHMKHILDLIPLTTKGDMPRARAAHAAVLHSQRLWIFGGYSENQEKEHQFLNDVYSLDLETNEWRCQFVEDSQNFAPMPRAGHSWSLLSPKELVCFGGGNSLAMFDELLIYNIELRRWFERPADGVGPCSRAGHSFRPINSQMFCLFGGGDISNVFSDCFILDVQKWIWIQLDSSGLAPRPRAGHSCVDDRESKHLQLSARQSIDHFRRERCRWQCVQ